MPSRNGSAPPSWTDSAVEQNFENECSARDYRENFLETETGNASVGKQYSFPSRRTLLLASREAVFGLPSRFSAENVASISPITFAELLFCLENLWFAQIWLFFFEGERKSCWCWGGEGPWLICTWFASFRESTLATHCVSERTLKLVARERRLQVLWLVLPPAIDLQRSELLLVTYSLPLNFLWLAAERRKTFLNPSRKFLFIKQYVNGWKQADEKLVSENMVFSRGVTQLNALR